MSLAAIVAALAGIACSNEPSAPGGSAPPQEPSSPGTTIVAPWSGPSELTLHLTGRARTTEWNIKTFQGEYLYISTEVEAAPKPIVVGLPVDTMLAVGFAGRPIVGEIQLATPSTYIFEVAPGLPVIAIDSGANPLELMIFSRLSAFPVRELIQSEPTVLRITDYVAPDHLSNNGRLRGEVSFLATEYYRVWSPDGSISIQTGAKNVKINATFTAPITHQVRYIDATGGK